MVVLNAYLVPMYDPHDPDKFKKSNFGEGDGYYVGLEVVKFLNDAIAQASNKTLDKADYFWSRVSTGMLKPHDLVCYVFDTEDQSIVKNHQKDPKARLPSRVGNTVWSSKAKKMISEVYLQGAMEVSADPDQRNRVLIITIIHEFMHNKLHFFPHKPGQAGFVDDLHTTGGRAARQGITYDGLFYDKNDVKAMAAGIANIIPQYVHS